MENELDNLKKALESQKTEAKLLAVEQTKINEKLNSVLAQIDVLSKQNTAAVNEVMPHQIVLDASELSELKCQFIALNDTVEKLTSKVISNEDDIADILERVVGLEAQTRRESLLIHNLPDIPKPQFRTEYNMIGYTCKVLNELMPRKFIIHPGHISTAHLIFSKNRNNNKPILLVKFVHRWMRNDFFYDRNSIRDKRVAITEHLCQFRLNLLREARKKFGYNNVFTDQSKIYRIFNGRTIKINHFNDIKVADRLDNRK